jgi:hypothetical protein
MHTERDLVNGLSTGNLSSADLSSSTTTSNVDPALKAAANARESLLQRFAIEVDRERGSATFILAGKSRADFIKEVNEVSQALYGHRAVSDLTLSRCLHDPAYLECTPPRTITSVQGIAPDSIGLSRSAQMEKGMSDVATKDLLVAHAAYLLATGEDMLRGLHSRSDANVVKFYRDGLHIYHDFTDAPFHDVGSSKKLL